MSDGLQQKHVLILRFLEVSFEHLHPYSIRVRWRGDLRSQSLKIRPMGEATNATNNKNIGPTEHSEP